MSAVIEFPSEPRIGWVEPDTGKFLGWSVDFRTPSRASYVVFVDGEWKAVSNDLSLRTEASHGR